jgi:oligopeptide/dipeptide ABC transporter ATP-binding protein
MIAAAQTVGLVGESGCGKSSLARALVGLLPITTGSVILAGCDISRVQGKTRREMRRKIQLVFQDPVASLNPRWSVAGVLTEALNVGGIADGREGEERVAQLLRQVGLPAEVGARFPHELSGGQRQRVAIARAVAVEPLVLIADEPTSALDVPVQARILELIRTLQQGQGLAVLLISHDLHLVAKTCQRIMVMYLGLIVESYAVSRGQQPRHPYARLLTAATPGLTGPAVEDIPQASGVEVPDLRSPPAGCPFAPRCPRRKSACSSDLPPLIEVAPGHWLRCPVVQGVVD